MNLDILNNSLIGRDFLRLKNKQDPTIDEFLDYRNMITGKMGVDRYPIEWYEKEVKAIDEILRIISK